MIQIVHKLNRKLFSPEFVSKHRKNEKDFTRKRALTFPHLLSFMLNMVNGSMQNELSRFFQVIQNKHLTLNSVTPAAFSKARKKFSFMAFKELNNCLVDTFYSSIFVKRWNGFRLLAVDGSVTKLPNTQELHDHFGKARNHSNRPAARLSQLYDVNNKITVDLQIGLHTTGERNLAVKHLECAGKDDLILYDRGYPAVWLFILQMQKNIHFCSRVPLEYSNIIKDFVDSKKSDALVEFPCVEKSLRRCRKLGLPTSPITLRLIRVELKYGEPEVLITSLLDRKQFPQKEFQALYHLKDNIVRFVMRIASSNLTGTLITQIASAVNAFRPERKFDRGERNIRRNKYPIAYKRVG